jgi:hypothetical protein
MQHDDAGRERGGARHVVGGEHDRVSGTSELDEQRLEQRRRLRIEPLNGSSRSSRLRTVDERARQRRRCIIPRENVRDRGGARPRPRPSMRSAPQPGRRGRHAVQLGVKSRFSVAVRSP